MRASRDVTDPIPASVTEITDALLLYDDAILSRRFHEMLARHPEDGTRRRLGEVPLRIVESEEHIREGARQWERATSGILTEDFVVRAERLLIDTFLTTVEAQIRLGTFMARRAPTREIRDRFEAGVSIQREVAETLRRGILRTEVEEAASLEPGAALDLIQHEQDGGDLRSQLENAIRGAVASGRAPRSIHLSDTALRHLRDQGCFQRGETTLLGVPVLVDLGWEGSVFAVETVESIPLEEILHGESFRGT